MKTQILIAAMVAGLTLAAADASAMGRGGAAKLPDFATLDTDGNGQLTQEELQAAGAARFAATDTNGDGALSAEELAAAAQERQANRVSGMIEKLDKNGDGLLQADEMPEPRRGGDRMEHRFDHADTNDDGTLSAEEFAEMSEKHGRRGGKHGSRRGN